MSVSKQEPTTILPQSGVGSESVANALTHPSIGVPILKHRDKTITVFCTEVVAAAAPGNLQVWVEVASQNDAAFYARLGTPVVIAGTGVNGAVQTVVLPWVTHSEFARLVVQTPVVVAGERWNVVGIFMARGDY